MTIFDDIGDWFTTGNGTNIWRIVSIALPTTYVGQIISVLPGMSGPLQYAVSGLTTVAPGLIRGDDFMKAVLAEYTYTAIRAATALAANPAILAKANLLTPQIQTALAEVQKTGAQIAPEAAALIASPAAQNVIATQAARYVNDKIVVPVNNWLNEQSEVLSRVTAGKDIAAQANIDYDAAFEQANITPEQLANATYTRPDAAAIAINHHIGERVYDADMFDAATGRFVRDPETLSRLYKNALLRNANRHLVAALQKRLEKAIHDTPSYNPDPGGVVEERTAAELRDVLTRIDPNAEPLHYRYLQSAINKADRVEAMSVDELQREIAAARLRCRPVGEGGSFGGRCIPNDIPYLERHLRAKHKQIENAQEAVSAADRIRRDEETAQRTPRIPTGGGGPSGTGDAFFGAGGLFDRMNQRDRPARLTTAALLGIVTSPFWYPFVRTRILRRA